MCWSLRVHKKERRSGASRTWTIVSTSSWPALRSSASISRVSRVNVTRRTFTPVPAKPWGGVKAFQWKRRGGGGLTVWGPRGLLAGPTYRARGVRVVQQHVRGDGAGDDRCGSDGRGGPAGVRARVPHARVADPVSVPRGPAQDARAAARPHRGPEHAGARRRDAPRRVEHRAVRETVGRGGPRSTFGHLPRLALSKANSCPGPWNSDAACGGGRGRGGCRRAVRAVTLK